MNQDFRDLFFELNAAEARYLLVGGYATMLYSQPRYTKDLDVWVEPTLENAVRVHVALTRFGAPVSDLTALELTAPGQIFQIGLPPNRIDILTAIGGVEFAPCWERRQGFSFGDVPIFALHIDDLILNKRTVGRLTDLVDVEWLEKAKVLRNKS